MRNTYPRYTMAEALEMLEDLRSVGITSITFMDTASVTRTVYA